MNILNLTEKQCLTLWREEAIENEQGDWVDVEIVEEPEWVDGGKYSSAEIIFKFEGKYYRFEIVRSGSYFSHYEYEVYSKPEEVEQHTYTKTVTEWRAV